MKTCEYRAPTDEVVCGMPAVCVIKYKVGKLTALDDENKEMGRGVGSRWVAICEHHKNKFPDCEGFDLNEVRA